MDQEKNKKQRHVKWDEEKLKETEKYRGTYQKIDQPKTPYRANHNNSDEENDMDEEREKTPEELQIEQSLKKAEQNRETNKRNKIDIAVLNAKLKEQMAKFHEEGEMQEEESEQQIKKREEFKKKRAAHYNEFKKIQQAKMNKWEDDDDD